MPSHLTCNYGNAGGGLLAALPREQADSCVRELVKAGYDRAATIGQIEKAVSQKVSSAQPEGIISIT